MTVKIGQFSNGPYVAVMLRYHTLCRVASYRVTSGHLRSPPVTTCNTTSRHVKSGLHYVMPSLLCYVMLRYVMIGWVESESGQYMPPCSQDNISSYSWTLGTEQVRQATSISMDTKISQFDSSRENIQRWRTSMSFKNEHSESLFCATV